ncbi:MAG: DUF89 family protein [Spirochaetales bacterium]|nr:DUF89 family protein [Spirochaetales bacterium]
MKTYLDCIPCFFKQSIEACKMIGLSDDKIKSILDKVALHLPEIKMLCSPPEMGGIIHRIIREQTNNPDPYKELKEKSNEIALTIYPDLKRIIQNSENRFLKAIEIAIAGNIIDYGAIFDLDLNKEIRFLLDSEEEKMKKEDSKYFTYTDFIESLKNAKTLLYLADNAGEIVFDRILIEEIIALYPAIHIYCAVRGYPVINDCTVVDAVSAGIDRFVTVISNGLDIPGTIVKSCSEEFRNIWNQSDLIISKGQGNFESLSVTKKNIFFMFIAKCQVLTRYIGCNVRDIILCRNGK